MTLKKIHRAEMLYKVLSIVSLSIATLFVISFFFFANEDSILQTIVLKVVSIVGLLIFMPIATFFKNRAEECEIRFEKTLKYRESRAAFKVEMKHL